MVNIYIAKNQMVFYLKENLGDHIFYETQSGTLRSKERLETNDLHDGEK